MFTISPLLASIYSTIGYIAWNILLFAYPLYYYKIYMCLHLLFRACVTSYNS